MGEPESLSAPETLDDHLRRHSYDRLIMLSDGVFAIAITLAALEIRAPDGAPTLASLFDAIGTQIGAYLVSFVVIASFWISHRDLFARLKAVDKVLSSLTLAMLCVVALIPASTHLVYMRQTTSGSLRFYALTMVVAGAFNSLMWLYVALRPAMLIAGETRLYRLGRAAAAAIVPLLFLIVLISPTATVSLKLVLAVVAVSVLFRRFVLPRLARPR